MPSSPSPIWLPTPGDVECPTCGYLNTPQSERCGVCGAKLIPQPEPAELPSSDAEPDDREQ